ncbi:MAG: DUF4810 domain-containing protein [Proteobacteria bacterium]|nr:DUF4810 domain-containing protein [Pseudomonadota bacterium]
MKKYVLLILISILLVGCVTTQNRPEYAWGDYSSSLYGSKKTPTDESLKNHKELLLSIMEESKTKNYRVPPGVFCEYGYILLKEGKKEEAFTYFDLEEQTYPESRVFIQNLKTYASKSSKKDDTPKKDNNGGSDSQDSKDKAANTDSK